MNLTKVAVTVSSIAPEKVSAPILEDDLPAEPRFVRVWSGEKKKTGTGSKHETRPQIIEDHLTRITKTGANEKVPVRTRIEQLQTMARQYSTGWPFKNREYFTKFAVDGVPVLTRIAQGLADQLLSIEKQKAAGQRDTNFGKIDA